MCRFKLLTSYEMQQNHMSILKLLPKLVTAFNLLHHHCFRKTIIYNNICENHAARKTQSAAQNSFTDA